MQAENAERSQEALDEQDGGNVGGATDRNAEGRAKGNIEVGAGLRLHGVTVRRGEILALDDVDVLLPAGQITLLWGGNGCGKTTMLLALAGCLDIEGGHVDGLAGKRVALVPQAPPTPDRLPLTVRAAVEMGCWPARGLLAPLTAADRERVVGAMETMRITDLADRQLSRVSGGQRQRTLVAQALVQQAPILLADEPTAAADVASTEIIHEVLRQEAARGAVVVIASHDPDVREFADNVVEMRAGHVTRVVPGGASAL
ncbi:MAG: ATP-binding cassette domain-containing protein [Buchananella hordeovulneris]|nr:ATP-binding cassette domain-containing protein [Buchananella hordeovulneris]